MESLLLGREGVAEDPEEQELEARLLVSLDNVRDRNRLAGGDKGSTEGTGAIGED